MPCSSRPSVADPPHGRVKIIIDRLEIDGLGHACHRAPFLEPVLAPEALMGKAIQAVTG